MINAIVFSKDRASQLRLLIESIQKNAPGLFKISIIYKSTTEEYQNGYDKLILECGYLSTADNIIFFYKEENFKQQTINLLDNKDYEYSCFFTDDDIIFRQLENFNYIRNIFNDNLDLFCFSLRLGVNVKKCYTMQADNVLKNEQIINDDFIIWDWTKHYLDFGYPLSVDGHIFKTKDILKLTKRISFQNPNTLEIAWQIYDNYPKQLMASYKESKLVNSPNNMVQNVIQNVSSKEFGITTKELNDLYLKDEIINLNAIDFNSVDSCHQELKLEFIKKPHYASI